MSRINDISDDFRQIVMLHSVFERLIVAVGMPVTQHPPGRKLQKEDRMDRLDDYLQRISAGKIDGALQNEIANKVLELLAQEKDSLGTREKILFAQAVRALSTSINSIHKPNEAGLRRCLIALREVLIPADVIDESYTERDDEAKHISYAMLVTTVEMIKRRILSSLILE